MSSKTSSKFNSGMPAILKVISPLFFLILPIIIFTLAKFWVSDYSETVSSWMIIGSYVMGGAILLWVIVRLGF